MIRKGYLIDTINCDLIMLTNELRENDSKGTQNVININFSGKQLL